MYSITTKKRFSKFSQIPFKNESFADNTFLLTQGRLTQVGLWFAGQLFAYNLGLFLRRK